MWSWGTGTDWNLGTSNTYSHSYPVQVGSHEMNLMIADWVYVNAGTVGGADEYQYGLGTGMIRTS